MGVGLSAIQWFKIITKGCNIPFSKNYLLARPERKLVMALIYCKKCVKKISDKAASCPHCGVVCPVICKDCGKEFSGEAEACPQCGRAKRMDPRYAVTPTVVVGFLFLWFVMDFIWDLIL